MKPIFWITTALFAVCGAVHAEEDFKCLEGAKDPAPYKPGNIVRWCEITKDGQLLYHGSVWRWHRNGQQASKEFYVYGKPEGESPSWYANGKRSSLGTFKGGSKVGLWKYWDEAGWLKFEVTYAEPTNSWVEYYPSGSKRATGQSVPSGKVGKWTYWDDKGTVKATCDFQSGLFALPSQPCQVISNELMPQGFSRPIPLASMSSDREAELRVATQTFLFSVPTKWVADTQAGKKEQSPLVIYEQGGSWRGGGANIYVRVLFKEKRSMADIAQGDAEEFKQNVADYTELKVEQKPIKNGKPSIAKTIRYKPITQTDSPFSIVSTNTVYETLNFVDVSDQVVLLVVLTGNTEQQLKDATPAMSVLLNSLRLKN